MSDEAPKPVYVKTIPGENPGDANKQEPAFPGQQSYFPESDSRWAEGTKARKDQANSAVLAK